MVQSIAGTHLLDSWMASARRPCIKLEIQWDRVNWTNETSRLLSYTIDHSLYNQQIGLPGMGLCPSGRATLALDNKDFRYSPSNPSSPLYSYIQNGIYRIPVRLWAGYYYGETQEMLRQFTGEIEQPQIWEDPNGRQAVITCLDASLPLLQAKGSTIVYPNYRPDQFIGVLIALGGPTINLIANPSFEVDTSGWATMGGTVARSAAVAPVYGDYVAVVNPGSVGDGIYSDVSAVTAAGTQYTLSAYVYAISGAPFTCRLILYDNGSGGAQYVDYPLVAGWQRLTLTRTFGDGVMRRIYIENVSGTSDFFVDAVQLEQLPYATPYCDTRGGIPYQCDAGMSKIPYAWLDDENIWQEMGLIAQADGGMVYFDEFGTARYERMTHWLEAADHTAVQAILDRGKCAWLEDQISWRDCYTKVIVETQPRYLMALTELYNAPDAIEIGPGATVERIARLRWPNYGLVTPVAGTDYICVNSAMMDMGSALSLSMTQYGQRVNLRFKNTDANYTIYLLDFRLRGVPLAGDESQEEERKSNLGIVPGDKDYAIRGNTYLQTAEQASRLAGFLRDRLQRPRRILMWKGPAAPWLQLGDRVRVVDTPSGVDVQGYVLSKTDEYSGEWSATLLVLPASTLFAYSSYFRLGVSAWNSPSDPVFY